MSKTSPRKKPEPEAKPEEKPVAQIKSGIFILAMGIDDILENDMKCRLFSGNTIEETIVKALDGRDEYDNPWTLHDLHLVYLDARVFSEQRQFSLSFPVAEALEGVTPEV